MESVTRNGEALDVEEHADEILVKAGDQIRISAEDMNPAGQAFKQWEVQIGNLHISYPACLLYTSRCV